MLLSPPKMKGASRLQLGAGTQAMTGWLNLDLQGPNVRWDLSRPLPLPDNSVGLIYSEHFIEHVPLEAGQRLLGECHRVLIPGGHIRISTPNMRVLAENYLNGTNIEMEHANWFPATPCQAINEGVRNWGHQFLYDEPELRSSLEKAGFGEIETQKWRESSVPELRGLETRPDFGDLIIEAVERA
jgi:predicted SAM-dependent methyltransferase